MVGAKQIHLNHLRPRAGWHIYGVGEGASNRGVIHPNVYLAVSGEGVAEQRLDLGAIRDIAGATSCFDSASSQVAYGLGDRLGL